MKGERAYSEPFLGRADEFAHASACLAAGTGLIIVGAEGSGRTRFARELGAQAGTELRARLRVGDDLALFSDDDLGRWAAAVRSGSILPIATAPAFHSQPVIDDLVRRGRVRSIVLGALTARELHAIVEHDLGAPVHPGSLPELVPARGGDDIVSLRETVAEATRTGALVLRDGFFVIADQGIRAESARSRAFSRAGSDVRLEVAEAEDILDLLALAPGLELTNARAVLATLERSPADVAAALERLEASGYVAVDRHASTLHLAVRDGVDELLIPRGMGVFRRYRLANALAEALSRVAPARLSAAETIALARHGTDLGIPVAAEVLVAAARASLRTPRIQESLAFASAAIDAGGGFEAELARADAEAQAGRDDESLKRLLRLQTDEADHEKRARVLHSMSGYARDRNRRVAESVDGDSLAQLSISPLRRDVLRGFRHYNLGRVVEAAALIRPALAVLTGMERAEGYLQIGVMDLMLGHITDAAAALDEAETAYLAEGADASHVHFVRSNVNILRGRAEESLLVTRAAREQAAVFGQPVAQAYCGWAIGTLIMASGSLAEASRELRTSLDILDVAGVERIAELVKLDLALCLAQAGDGEAAREVGSRSSEDDDGSELAVSGKILVVEGWMHLDDGDRDRARASFLQAADVYARGGFHLPSVAALLDAARVGGAAELADRIATSAAGMEGEYIVMVRSLSSALGALDELSRSGRDRGSDLAARFEAAGVAASRIGHHVIAAEAFDYAAVLYGSDGLPREAAAAARSRDDHLAACGLDRTPSGVTARSAPLSGREIEIARLAADGASNREIAEKLVLSVRTVETHLQRVYAKVGVRRRSDLARALRGELQSTAEKRTQRG
ncbi:LuxR C-terminal-related transcriptional regulator [Herbiconiux sp. A18JL235]|uniref:LuxR C-terminal-related transcriptional regulator n=1 Tax=Herbiconiux sp. A18JL235 TaxID=3152363 RepID=A0AB39BDZ0_9MICO